jgi:EmrB/QacA subfamily drug resistance transporter
MTSAEAGAHGMITRWRGRGRPRGEPERKRFMSTPDTATAEERAEAGSSQAYDGHGHSHLGLALAVISAAQLMVVLDATIVNIALPYLKSDLEFSDANLSWVVNAYTLAFGGLLLLGGRAGDLLGRRKVFMFGVLLFALASLLGGFAQTETWLICARVLQGVGAAVASPTALSLVTTTFPPGKARNRAFAVYAAMSGAGAAIGLILGGALTEASWRWTFFINVPIGLFVAFMAPRVLGESERQRGRFDLPGAVTATGGLVSLVYGLTHAATDSWGDPVTVATITLGAVLLVVFLLLEAFSAHALMPFRVLAERNRAVSYLAMLAIGSAMFAMFYFLSLFVQVVLGYSSLKAGFAFLPFSFGIVFAAQIASQAVSRMDPRWIAGTGGVIAATGMLWMSRLEVDSTYLGGLIGPMVVIAVGLGLLFVPLTLTAVAGVAKADSGVASAVLNTMQQVGGALGLATLSTVATTAATARKEELASALASRVAAGDVTPDRLPAIGKIMGLQAMTEGYTTAFVVAAVIIAAAAVVVMVGLNVKHGDLATDSPVHVGG